MDNSYDFVVVGGGLVGLSTARALLTRHPTSKVALLEKEDGVAKHQSGRNSGVVHSGIYYAPGSQKAQLTEKGKVALASYCREKKIPWRTVGKLIIATTPEEVPALEGLYQRAKEDPVGEVHLLDGSGIRGVEPKGSGLVALHLPDSAITEYTRIAKAIATDLWEAGATVLYNHELHNATLKKGEWHLETSQGVVNGAYFLNTAGLQADRLAWVAGANPSVRIFPFRGEYWRLKPESSITKALLYPAPNLGMPFLGVHFTPEMDGGTLLGPNALLAWHREGYERGMVENRQIVDALSWTGFWCLGGRHLRAGWEEWKRSRTAQAVAHSARRLVPSLPDNALQRALSGVRAQAVDQDGNLVNDFVVEESPQALHLLNAPSPAATACLAIGEYIAKMLP
ncbi:L-2-hydroxyglutarate oxidase [bacterium]|nr:L-2-hydroxyglutarate oxidase [bacterium]